MTVVLFEFCLEYGIYVILLWILIRIITISIHTQFNGDQGIGSNKREVKDTRDIQLMSQNKHPVIDRKRQTKNKK